MLRTIKLRDYHGHKLECTLSTRYKHYRVSLDDQAIGWIIPGARPSAYNDLGESIGEFTTMQRAAEAVAEWHLYF